MTVRLSLAFPPSVNNLFCTRGKARVPTPKYRAWRDAARIDLLAQRSSRISGPFTAELTLERPDKRARDLDNYFKAPLDALVSAGVLESDHLSQRLSAAWAGPEPIRGARVHISLESAT